MNIHKSQPRSSGTNSTEQSIENSIAPISFLFFVFISVFQIWLCTHSSAPHIAINNERGTRSMWPCKIQHNAASVTSDVIAASLCDLRVISINVNVWCRFDPCAWWTGHTKRLDKSYSRREERGKNLAFRITLKSEVDFVNDSSLVLPIE